MLILGLTGLMAAGKSTTAALFAAAGAAVFDADAAVRALYAGPAAAEVERLFPGTVRDGVVDRGRLSAALDRDAGALSRLEALIHPLVAAEEEAFNGRQARAGRSVLVIDSPLLLETGGAARVDAVILVTAPEPLRRQRALARPGMTEDKLALLLARQWPEAEKRAWAHFTIDTGAGREAAGKAVRDLLRAVAPLAAGR